MAAGKPITIEYFLVLDQGRQRLYGNVGYRIIEANVRELLHDSRYGEATRC